MKGNEKNGYYGWEHWNSLQMFVGPLVLIRGRSYIQQMFTNDDEGGKGVS